MRGLELLEDVDHAKPSLASNSRVLDERMWPRLSDVEAVRIVVNNDRTVMGEAIRRACTDEPALCMNAEPAVRSKAARLTTESRAESIRTLQAMRGILNGLTRFNGRKTILLMSEGFIAEESWPLVEDAVGLAARANARIYTLDARGLDKSMRTVMDVAPGNDSVARMLEQMDFGADAVNSLAVDTGGFVVRNRNILAPAIAQIADDAGNYYVLGYRPATPADGKFHRINVKVTRPGVSVRARRGYLASPRPAAVTTTAEPTPALSPLPAKAPEHAEASVGEASEPAPAPVATGVVVPGVEPVNGLHLRPDADVHANDLAGGSLHGTRTPQANTTDVDASAGWDAYQRGDLESARQSLSVAAARPGSAPWVQYALGQSEYGLGHYADAVAAWERVRTAVPGFEPVYFDLVDGYRQLKDYGHAMELLKSAEQRWKRDPEVLNAMGVVQISSGAIGDAIHSFERAIEIAPRDGVGYFNAAKAYELGYFNSHATVSQTRAWFARGNARNKAIDYYKRYLTIGGPFERSAREGLTRLGAQP